MRFYVSTRIITPLPLFPSRPSSGVLLPSTHTASADEGGNESRGGTEVNYQIDVRPQSTLPPFSPCAPPSETNPRHFDAIELVCRGESGTLRGLCATSPMISSRRRGVLVESSLRKHDCRDRGAMI